MVVDYRHAAGLTQEQLCERLGCQRSYLARIEAGEYFPGLEVGPRLAPLLGLTLEQLVQASADRRAARARDRARELLKRRVGE